MPLSTFYTPDSNQSRSTENPSNWFFTPAQPYESIGFIDSSTAPTINIATEIENYIEAFPDLFAAPVVKVFPEYPVVNSNPLNCFTISGEIADAQNGYQLTENNLNVNTVVSFQLSNLPQGHYPAYLRFEVWGLYNPLGIPQLLDTVKYRINIHRLGLDEIYINPAGFVEMSYHLGGTLPVHVERELYIKGNFIVEAGKHISITGANITLVNSVNGIKTYSGNGSQTVSFHLDSTINNEPDLETYFSTNVIFKHPGSTITIGVKIWLFGNEDIQVSPQKLEFTSIKGVSEADYQKIDVWGIGQWTFQLPTFLRILGDTEGYGTGYRKVKPVASYILGEGVYNGVIKVTAGNVIKEITVKHTVIGRVDPGYSKTGVNFTLDRSTISKVYANNTEKINFNINILSYSINRLLQNEISAAFGKGVFKNQTEFWLGKKVHKAMDTLKSLKDIEFAYLFTSPEISLVNYRIIKYYKLAEVSLKYTFQDRSTNNESSNPVLHTNIKYLKGRKPRRLTHVAGILDYFESAIRVTPSSFAFLSIYRNEENSTVKLYRNDSLVTTLYPNREEYNVFAIQIAFNGFSPGDIIKLSLSSDGISSIQGGISQEYIVFPQGNQSYHIAWVNEHNTLSMLEFTGEYIFKSEHKTITNLTFDSYLEKLQKVGTKRKLMFQANTGWILKSNQERIFDLVNSNIAWIVFSDNRPPIEIIPDDAKLTNIDSEAGTYQYTVEFTINPSHELDNPTF